MTNDLDLSEVKRDGEFYLIDLDTPIQAHGETLNTLRMREPRMRHMKALDKVEGGAAKTTKLISVLADIPLVSAEEITTLDLTKRINPVLLALMGESIQTGETS
jgi:hypothetical protein